MLDSRPLRLLAASAVVLVAGHLVGLVLREAWGVDPQLGVVRQFDLNAEGNLAAWFSSFLLTCSAALCLLVAKVRSLRGLPLARRWAAMSALFLVMAVDETAQLHDMATGPLRHGLGLDFGILYFAWLIPALLVVVAAGFAFAPVVASMSATVRPRILLAALVYLCGAVAFEMVGGNTVAEGRTSLVYLLTMTMEETLEITGGFLFLLALLHQLRELGPRLVVTWTGRHPAISEQAPASTGS